ncbi:cytochrome d ubiquinol oxidase subunit I [Saccharomonospora amisosensis]|uniref:Cytochrome d ubiquinol oxidase subunit I n=1 Tax=Saccharomonospora amisosensis TaxID=1128677 RepID=A0A7X5UPU6_9PSEU|nr:cytochrome ubiquinol oxidase subunit I [Saccharomonospora amisosensis]NIJ12033.1 cytochrome d ubiquinol oxidase subunit I [Saccharomonospora amisosensis]
MTSDALDLARWQFGVTIVYHFLFVPVTIGMAWFVAGMQTAWQRTGKERYLRATRFFGKLFLINFALGVVTGIVQEFQFGMNWALYSRYVGDVFGAPLAIEALVAFFLESTFIGLWIFGWDRLRPKLHLATIWLVAIGTTASAYFILAANSWMQNPVGTRVTEDRAEMVSLAQVFFQPLQVWHFVHTLAIALITAGLLVLAVAVYWLRRGKDVRLFRAVGRNALLVTFVSSVVAIGAGHFQAQILTDVQPMKIAAAEALYESASPAPLSLFAVGPWEKRPERVDVNIELPYALSVLSTNSVDGRIKGINEVQQEYRQQYGPGDYTPIIGTIYWTWRVMITIGFAVLIFSAVGLWLTRKGRPLERARRFHTWAYLFLATPFIAATAGWLFTEMGRQPWIVQGLLFTREAVSPYVGVSSVVFTLVGFTLAYTILGAVEVWLITRAVKKGPEEKFEGASTKAPLPPMLY